MIIGKFAKRIMTAALAIVSVAGASTMAFAEEAGHGAAAAASSGGGNSLVLAAIFLASGLAIGIGSLGPGIGQGNAVKAACEGMARNPGMSGKITVTMLLGLAIMESLAIYALVISLLLLFVFAGKFGA